MSKSLGSKFTNPDRGAALAPHRDTDFGFHFYEAKGLIRATRTSGNQRRYRPAAVSRVKLIRLAHSVGLPLTEIGNALSVLPWDRMPDPQEWNRVSMRWRDGLQSRIDKLVLMRDELTETLRDEL